MELQGIAILPTRENFNERLERDLILELIKLKPQTFIFIDPNGCSALNDLSVEYDTKVNIDGQEYKCDMGFLDDLNKVLIREEIPNTFISPEITELYHFRFSRNTYFKKFLTLLNRVYPEYKVAVLSPGNLRPIDGLEIGRSVRESIERAQKKSILIVFSDIIDQPQYLNLFKSAAQSNDFTTVVDLDVKPDEQLSLNSLVIGIGATDSLLIESSILEKNEDICYLFKFVVEMINLKEKNHREFVTDSIIKKVKDQNLAEFQLLRSQENILQRMVRETLKLWLTQRKRLDFNTFAELEIEDPKIIERLKLQRTGVFVTVTKNGQYRCSMGTVNPIYDNIGEEIINNAIEAAFSDPDRTPLALDELEECLFEVEVLNPLESIDDISELNPHKYGIVVEQGFKRGVVLPNIKGIETAEQQLKLAKDRAGIIEEIDSFEPLLISKFSVETF